MKKLTKHQIFNLSITILNVIVALMLCISYFQTNIILSVIWIFVSIIWSVVSLDLIIKFRKNENE